MDYSQPAPKDMIDQAMKSLKANGITSEIVETADDAKKAVLLRIPEGSEVMTMSSITLEQSGITSVINESGKYDSVKKKLSTMDRTTQAREMRKLGAAPDWSIGSVHAITQEGKIYIASNTGSQLPAYVYGAGNVIWVVSTKKVVKDEKSAMERLQEFIVPQESVHMRQLYSLPDTFHTFISKLLIVNRELIPGRIHVVFVNQALGF